MLGGDEDPLDLDRALASALVDLVADGHLRLPVRSQVREDVRFSHFRETLGQLVGDHDRERHQLLRLPGRVPVHHPLVSRTEQVERVRVSVLRLIGLVDALGDVRGLPVDRHHHAAGLGVEPVLRPRVADLGDALSYEAPDVYVDVGRDLAGDDDEPGRDQRLARDTPVRVAAYDGVENRVRDLVGDLVRMALGYGLGGEGERTLRHGGEAYLPRPAATPSWAGVA